MGQYYKPIILDNDDHIEHWLSCYDFDSGAKLMEHSWLGNDFVAAVESLLAQEAPRRVVWAGDYADAEVDDRGNPRTVKSDAYTSGEGEANLYVLADDMQPTVESAVRVTQTSHPFLVNWDKQEYVNKRRVTRATYAWDPAHKRGIHPLPLLTVEGNGRGGGDFHIDDEAFAPGGWLSDRSGPQGNLSLIGSWARDHISVQSKPPNGGFTEIKFDLVEMGSVVPA